MKPLRGEPLIKVFLRPCSKETGTPQAVRCRHCYNARLKLETEFIAGAGVMSARLTITSGPLSRDACTTQTARRRTPVESRGSVFSHCLQPGYCNSLNERAQEV
jgi:hypothetical protein